MIPSGTKCGIIVFGFPLRICGMINVVAPCIVGVVCYFTDLLGVTDGKGIHLDMRIVLEIVMEKSEGIGITLETVNGMDANTTLLSLLKESECHEANVGTDVEYLGIVCDMFEKGINDFLVPDASDRNRMLKDVVIETSKLSSIHIFGTDNYIHYQEEGRLDLGRIL